MKRTSSVLMLFILFVLTACGGPFSSTTSMLIVTKKGHSSDYKEYWIDAYDSNNETQDESFKIVVQEEMVWNLIEENREYFSVYAKKGDQPWTLEQIEHHVIVDD